MLAWLVASAAICHGQTRDEVIAWARAERQSSMGVPDLRDVSFGWRTEDHATMTAAELAALEAEVKGKPDHPRLHEAEEARKYFSSGPAVQRARLYSSSKVGWRFNTESADGTYYLDLVRARDRTWQLSPSALTIYDPALVASEAQSALVTYERVIVPIYGRLVHGGLNAAVGLNVLMDARVQPDGLWLVVLNLLKPDGTLSEFEMSFVVEWLTEQKRGFVRESMISGHASPQVVGERYVYGDWRFEPHLNLWVSNKVERYLSNGRLARVTVYEGAAPLPQGGLEALTAIPRFDGTDPIRGSLTFTNIYDQRSNVRTTMTPDGLTKQPILPAAATSSGSTMRALGWIMLGVLASTTGVLIVRRRLIAKQVHQGARP